jgi:hypothetical protein
LTSQTPNKIVVPSTSETQVMAKKATEEKPQSLGVSLAISPRLFLAGHGAKVDGKKAFQLPVADNQ